MDLSYGELHGFSDVSDGAPSYRMIIQSLDRDGCGQWERLEVKGLQQVRED